MPKYTFLLSAFIFAEVYAMSPRRLLPAAMLTLKNRQKAKKLNSVRVKPIVRKSNPSILPTKSSNIAANSGDGIFVTNHSNNNSIQNNIIGLNASLEPLGNKGDGVAIENFSSDNIVGGSVAENGNIIAYNKNGVVIGATKCDASVENSIVSNSVFDNKCIGIGLANDGVTQNHKINPVFGPNNFQNYPVLEKAIAQTSNTQIIGSLKSVPSTSFLIQFFSNPKKDREGQTQIGQTTVSTNGKGKASFNVLVSSVAQGTFIVSTATRLNAQELTTDTSEFSKPIKVKNCK